MDEEQRRIHIEATKAAVREWLDEEKQKTYQTIGSWFVNVLCASIIAVGIYLMMWVEKNRM